ncbi:class I SAM-dependent methyltransferase [Candidatus Parcubacteria bacterium]|nr:class I SAM-dependent methyltransferase [Candidatus Parcubacteria bacterium]
MDNLEFEKVYKEKGINAQRRYPNEALIRFLTSNYFHLNKDERKNCKILELGCGSGGNLEMMVCEGFTVYGIDIAETGIEVAKKMMEYKGFYADLRVGNMKKLDFEDNYFDAIVDTVSVQHTDMDGHIKVFKEAYRRLKYGGKFFSWHLGARSISFLDGGGKYIDRLTLDKIINPNTPIQSGGMICFLNPTDAKEMLELAGFKNIKIEIINRTYCGMTKVIEYLEIQAEK